MSFRYGNIVHDMMKAVSEPTREIILKIISWILYSRRSIRVLEVMSGAAINPKNRVFTEENRLLPKALERCKPLIEEGQNGTITLIHFTARE